jgi:DNA-binding protein HU-beta
MNKEHLVSAIAKESGMTKKDAAVALDATLKCVTEALKNNEKVTLVGFGTFQVRERAARSGRNPKTGQPLQIPAKKVPIFSAGKGLREAVSPAAPVAKKKATSKKK